MMAEAVSAVLSLLGAARMVPTQFDKNPVAEALWAHLSKGLGEAAVGDWVTYEVSGGSGRISHWRLAAVGEKTDDSNRPALWIEMEVGEHALMAAPLVQIRMLVAKRTGLAMERISRLIVALGPDRPQEVPLHALETMRREIGNRGLWAPGVAEEAGGMTIRPGHEARLMTGAGTIPSVPIEVVRGDVVVQRIWMSRRVPLLHLSKLEVPALGYSMQVSAFGTGATPRIILPRARPNRIGVEPFEENPPDAGQ